MARPSSASFPCRSNLHLASRVGHDGAAADLAHPDPLRPESPRGGHWHGFLHEIRKLDGPLQRLLTADGASRHEGEPPHAKGVEQAFLRPYHVPDRDHREAHPVGPARARLDRRRSGAARAAPEHVGADDEVLLGVDGEPRPDHRAPPAAASVLLGGTSRGVRVPGEGVDEENRVVGGLVQLSPGLVGQGDLAEAPAEFRLERAYGVVDSALSGRSVASAGPWV